MKEFITFAKLDLKAPHVLYIYGTKIFSVSSKVLSSIMLLPFHKDCKQEYTII